MLKFRGEFDQHPAPERRRPLRDGMLKFFAGSIPTVDDVNEATAPLTRACAWQIITRQGLYWGDRSLEQPRGESPWRGDGRRRVHRQHPPARFL